MSNLVDINRLQFQKIFEAHQQKGGLTYTEALKICSSLKIFPDLLASQEIRKIFLTLSHSDNGTERLSFLQFESFLKICAKQGFRSPKKNSDNYESLINYIKDSSHRRYGTNLESNASKGRSLSKTLINHRNSKLNISTPKNGQKSFFKANDQSTVIKLKTKSPGKTAKKNSTVISLLSPGIKRLNKVLEKNKNKYSALTERKDGQYSACSTSPSPCKPSFITRTAKVFANFKTSCTQINTNKYLMQKKIKNLFFIEKERKDRKLMMKMAFRIWKLTM